MSETETCLIDKSLGSIEKMSVFISQNKNQIDRFSSSNSWVILSPIEASIKAKIESVGIPLKEWDINIYRGILTGYNEAFIIDQQTRDKLMEASPKNDEIIRPILLGKNIKRYSYSFDNKYVITSIFGSYKSLSTEYPSVYEYLLNHKDSLEKRGQCRYNSSGKVNLLKDFPGQHHWLELDNNPSQDYIDLFDKPKIAWGNLALSSQFSMVPSGFCINAPAVFIATDDLFLLAVLNSKLGDYYIKQLGVSRSGGYFEYKPMFVDKLPVPKISLEDKQIFSDLVLDLLEKAKVGKDTFSIEMKIDSLVFDLYDINQDERLIISKALSQLHN